MIAYRIADRRRPLLDGVGAMLHGGRWNSPGHRVVYAAETYAGAVLEILVHANLGVVPRTQVVAALHIPDDLPIQALAASALPGWNSEDVTGSRAFGDRWLREGKTAVLLVPSVVLQGREHNVLLNPDHPGFRRIAADPPAPVAWDARLFPSAQKAAHATTPPATQAPSRRRPSR